MEFDLIETLRRRTRLDRADVALGIGDDAALLEVPAGTQLVACTDTMVERVHFLPGTAAADIGWKSLAVNLSDLAAMGAVPMWALLALTLPDGDPRFVEGFADGFARLARQHGVALVGGDTTQGPLAVTVTALGSVPRDRALRRTGAQPGDAVFATGTLGDAGAALCLRRRGEVPSTPLAERMQRPAPRVAAGLALRGIASACIDVSDGLVADLAHICTESRVGAELDAAAMPVSATLAETFDAPACRDFALTGGDDYELCFTVPPAHAAGVVEALARVDCRATRIGRIVPGSGVQVFGAHGEPVPIAHPGWEHFA